jgi:hypothetical protein
VTLAPGIVVVIVHPIGLGPADDLAHALAHPFAARIGIASGQLHRGDVALPELARLVDDGG